MDFSKILYIDKDEQCHVFDGRTLQPASPDASKKYYTGLLVPPSALYLYSQKIASNLEDKQIEVKLDMAIYEEGGADENEEYHSAFVCTEIPGNESEEIVDLFAITDTQAQNLYSPSVTKTKAIDLMCPSMFIYETLYEAKDEGKVDVFIYLADEEAFVAIYHNGHYIAHRSLDSLARICSQTVLDIDSLKAMLKLKGLDETLYEEHEQLALSTIQSAFARSIERVVYTINHKQGIFGFSDIDNVYMDFEGDIINGFENIFSNFGLSIKDIKPVRVEGIEPKKVHEYICARYIWGVANEKHLLVNLSPFQREESIIKKPAGMFLLSAVAGLLLSVIIYAVFLYLLNGKDGQIQTLTKNISSAENVKRITNAQINELKKEIARLQEKKSFLENQADMKNKASDAIPLLSQGTTNRQNIMDVALEGLSVNELALLKLVSNGSEQLDLTVAASSESASHIANFIHYMFNKGYTASNTSQIFRKDNIYQSQVKVAK